MAKCKAITLLKQIEEKIMTSSSNATMNDSGHSRYSRRGCCRGNWSGMNIAAMVIGFVLFWPVGLLILYWNIKGRELKDLPGAVQEKWSKLVNGSNRKKMTLKDENSVFDEFQQTQYDRIAEIKEEIKNRARSFQEFRSDAKRRADEAEFKEFMSSDRSKDDK